MHAYRAIVDKRDQRAFLPRPIPDDVLRRILQAARMTGSAKNAEPNRLVVVRDRARVAAIAGLSLLGVPAGLHVNRVLGFGYIDPDRAAPPRSVARRRLPIEELTHWEGWRP